MHNSRSILGFLFVCLALVALIVALPALGVGTARTMLLVGLVLLCPLSMFFMMRAEGHGRDHGSSANPPEDPEESASKRK